MVLIEVRDERGRVVRQCNARCHRADPTRTSACVCGGVFRGIERRGEDPALIDPATVAAARESVVLADNQHVQLRIGA
jgi:hypothetical protein